MKNYSQLLKWGASHHPNWLVVLRVALGLLLFTKGIDFISNMVYFQGLVERQSTVKIQASWLPFVIAWAHIFAGLFIMVGLFTRAFCFFQLPIVTCALFVSIADNMLTGYALFEIIIAFILLILFVIGGGGNISLDRYYSLFKREKDYMFKV